MAKNKPDAKAHATKSVATNAMFKKAGKEALRQQTSRHTKDAIEKSTNVSRSNKVYKSKHVAKHNLEHPLATDFAGKIVQSKISMSTLKSGCDRQH